MYNKVSLQAAINKASLQAAIVMPRVWTMYLDLVRLVTTALKVRNLYHCLRLMIVTLNIISFFVLLNSFTTVAEHRTGPLAERCQQPLYKNVSQKSF